MFWKFFVFISAVKLLFWPAYRSTDFEVHRNWLAITHSLPISQWYYADLSEWTLDYPPLFAYFEYGLSHIAKFFDPEMLKVDNLNYASTATILFQRVSVIFMDFILVLGVKSCVNGLQLQTSSQRNFLKLEILAFLGLIVVDHIHFQYNGFLFGVLLLSVGKVLQRKFIQAAFLFSILLNLKHIFIYMAPAFGVFLLRFYCWQSQKPILNIIKLASVAMITLVISFGPFYDHIPQVLSRLFPFKRGLTHAYWAPNFWAMYNFADKAISFVYGIKSSNASFTSGLVQEFQHQVLPSISPIITFLLTSVFMVPCTIRLFLSNEKNCSKNFLRAIVLCACTSFMFGWHVHEKAILMVTIPLTILAAIDSEDAKYSFFLHFVANYSLLPLLFKPDLLFVKIFLYLTDLFLTIYNYAMVYGNLKIKLHEKLYLFGLIMIFIYEHGLHQVLNLKEKLPFLPLMITSVYCSLGIFYFYCRYYYKFLSTGNIVDKRKAK